MKPLGFTISVLQGTNRAVCASEADWSMVRPGSFLRVAKDEIFYTVGKANRIFYIKDFETAVDGRKIVIKDDVGINLCKGDTINITFKEWTLFTLLDIYQTGTGYKVDDKVYLKGGALSPDQASGLTQPTTFRVTRVNENGCILDLALESSGVYFSTPPTTADLEGGSGTGGKVDVEFKLLDTRKMVDRIINSIQSDHLEATIHLNYPLPQGVSVGKLSVQKWEILLTGPYIGESKINETYDIARDFTPNCDIPLLVSNSFSTSMIVNHGFQTIDAELAALKKEVADLKRLLAQ